MKNLIVSTIATCALLAAAPSTAQTREEQAFAPGGVVRVACDAGIAILSQLPGLGGLLSRAAQAIGLCPPGTAPAANPQPPTPVTAAPAASPLSPGLQVRIVAVPQPAAGQQHAIAPATPATVFRRGDGFAALVTANAPGYLEVWSVDERNSTFIEAHVLGSGTTIVLPRATRGFYTLTTEGGRDSLRLRFLPCRPGEAQAFAPQENAFVAAQLSALQQASSQIAPSLPICPIGQNVNLTQRNDALFSSPVSLPASYSAESGFYTAVNPARTAFVTDIALRRN